MPVVMTRIIQRCFLVLAFTGILLSCAQESTVSDPAPSSAPESSYTSVATNFFKTSAHTEATAGTSDFRIDDGSQTSDQKTDETLTEESKHDSPSTEFENSSTSSGGGEARDSTVELTTEINLVHSQGLFRAKLQNGKSTSADVSTEKLQDSSAGEVIPDKLLNLSADETTTDRVSSDSTRVNTSGSDQISRESTNVNPTNKSEEESTTITSTTQSTKTHSLDNSSNDSKESPVPSKGDAMSNSSDLGKNTTPEEAFSTTPSKVQTEDGEWEDNAKSATRKRSLNATNTLAEETTVTSSGQESSSNEPVMTEAKADDSVTHVNSDVSQKKQTGVFPTNRPTDEAETIVSSIAVEITKSPHTINGVSGNPDILSTQDNTPESKTTSASLDDAHLFSISSAALSSFSEDSIHPSENTDTTAQISNVEPDATTSIATSLGSRELEDTAPVQNSDSPFSRTSLLVTFDPNGMTHNYSQEPDSVTFTPQIFHVDGMPKDSYLSQNGKYIGEGINQSTPDDMEEVHSSEREREGTSTPAGGSVERERTDAEEEMSSKNTVQNTNQPMITPFSTVELFSILSTGSPGKTKDENAGLTDESEEMLNDSPDFEPVQSKSTAPTMTDDVKNFMNKYLEMNVSNDISHTTGASSQLTSKATHELEFSIDYQPEQSEFRPVTTTSPLGTPEPATIPPGSLDVGSQAPNEVTTTSGQPDNVSPDASSPTVLPNPAPSLVNQSTEATAAETTPGGNTSTVKIEENLSNTSIAGVAVKTSVSVSLPLSKLPNGTSSTVPGEVTSDAVLPNITEIILPVPIHVNKDVDGHPAPTVVSTEASTEASTVSTGLRIRKPKLKIGGGDTSEAPRTRKPFLAPPPKSSTTVGPPVSIFKNARTRMASITSSTTARPFTQFSTIRIHYASRLPGIMPSEHVFTLEPTTTTEPTTTETEEPFSDEPFTDLTQAFSMPSEDVVTLVKIAGYIVVDKGLRWEEQLNNRHSPEYKKKSKYVQVQLDRLFRTSGIGSRLWKTEIDGFSGKRKTRSVAVDFFLYIAKSPVEISTDHLRSIFHEKLVNNTFNRFTVDPSKTSFEILNEEPLRSTTEAPETEPEPVIPQWAIAVIVVGAASLIFIVLFAVVAILGRHHMRRRYSNKLNDEDSDRPSDWESKMAAAYENLAADTIYDAEDLHSDTYKKKHNSTFHGRPTGPHRADSWSSSDWSPPPRRPRPQVHRIVY